MHTSLTQDVVVVPNIVNYPETHIYEKDDAIHFLFLGVISEKKGVFDLLSVLIENQDEYRGKMFFHIGGIGETERLVAIIKEGGIGDFVFFGTLGRRRYYQPIGSAI